MVLGRLLHYFKGAREYSPPPPPEASLMKIKRFYCPILPEQIDWLPIWCA